MLKGTGIIRMGLLALAASLPLAMAQQSQQELPDAPSATQPARPKPQPAPKPTVSTQSPSAPPSGAKPSPAPADAAPADQTSSGSSQAPVALPPSKPSQPGQNSREEMYTYIRTVNQVIVPVTVKDSSGHLVDGLVKNDFSLYEEGAEQPINFFTSDPYPLSAAVVVDVGLSDDILRKVNETLPALAGAFSEYDEVEVYTYGSTVTKRGEFTAGDSIGTELQHAKREGRKGGAAVTGGPMAAGPTVNGVGIDPSIPHTSGFYHAEPRVLNDALLAAAMDLAKRDRTRRRVIFVISDGHEYRSRNSYGDVLKAMLTYGINVYAVAVGGSAVPGYRNLEQYNVPFTGSGNLLPKYAVATGGQIFPSFDRNAIETAYAKVTGEARNQYTIGYKSKSSGVATGYRGIEVRVHKGGLRVFAKDGYFPLPPGKP